MINVIKADKLDVNNIEIDKPIKNSKHYYSKIKYDGEPLYIQTQKVINYKDLSSFDTKDPYIEIELKDLSLYDKLSKLEDNILNSTRANWKLWMDKDIPLEVLNNMYNKLSKNFKKDETPRYKFKIPISKSKILTKIYDNHKKDCEIFNINSGDNLILILNIRGIKYNEKTFYLDIYITQIKVFESSIDLIDSNKCLIDSENEDINEDDIIDKHDLNNLIISEKIRQLKLQRQDEIDLIKQIELRIHNIDNEIKNINN